MAVGDDAAAAGYALVQQTDEVTNGATEINRTRDYIAELKALVVAVWPVGKGGTGSTNAAGARSNLGINSGTSAPSDTVGGNVNGNIYFKIIT